MQPPQPPRPGPYPPPYQQAYHGQPAPYVVQQPPPVVYVGRGGLGPGLHLAYAALTLATCGVAAPVWIIHAIMGRNRR